MEAPGAVVEELPDDGVRSDDEDPYRTLTEGIEHQSNPQLFDISAHFEHIDGSVPEGLTLLQARNDCRGIVTMRRAATPNGETH